jgi:hypothetical protein
MTNHTMDKAQTLTISITENIKKQSLCPYIQCLIRGALYMVTLR